MPYPIAPVPARRKLFLLGLYSSSHLHPLIQQHMMLIIINAILTIVIKAEHNAFVSHEATATPTIRSVRISPRRSSSSSSSARMNLGRIARAIVKKKKIFARVCFENIFFACGGRLCMLIFLYSIYVQFSFRDYVTNLKK